MEKETGISSEEQALRAAAETARKAMVDEPCQKNVENFTAVNKALDDYLAKKEAAAAEVCFPNIPAVEKYLKSEGWKIGKSKMYKDQAAGKIKAESDGTFLVSKVMAYAKNNLNPATGKKLKLTSQQERKQVAEAEKQEAAADLLRLKANIMKGEYIPKELMEEELAARAAFLKTDFENFFRSQAALIVTIVEGNQEKTPDLLAFCLEAAADWLDRYAKQGKFTVTS